MQAIIFLLFIVMTVMGLRYVFIAKDRVRDPFNKNAFITVTGIQRFLLFTFSTGIIMLSGLSAERLLVWIVLVILAILIDKHPFSIRSATIYIYVLYLLWLVISIVMSPSKVFGFRVFLKYLYPLLLMILAAKVTVMPIVFFRTLKNIFQMAIIGCVYLVIVSKTPLFLIGEKILWNVAAIQDFMLVGITIALFYFTISKKKKYLIYVLAFLSCSFVWVNRTGLLGCAITIVVFSFLRYKIKALPYVIVFIGLFLGVVLYVGDFRDKMFKKQLTSEQILEQGESLSTDDINSSGRFAMWEWSLMKFYVGHEWTGSGLGVLQDTFYNSDHPFLPLKVVHNDYVQILCDTGLIGLILYLLVMFSLIIHTFTSFWNQQKPMIVRMSAMIAGMAMAGMVSTLYTDNVVNYSLLTLSYPYGLYGLFLGLDQNVPRMQQRLVSQMHAR